MRSARWAVFLGIVVISGLFAYFNSGYRVAIGLGFTTLYQVSLSTLVFGAFLLGMIAMYLLGLGHDMRVRRELRRHGLLDAAPRPEPLARDTAPPEWGTST